jgi:cytochrome c peroxidase
LRHSFAQLLILAATAAATANAADFQQQGLRLALRASTSATGTALRDFHTWTLDFSPHPKLDAVAFEATMPAHGHGLATQPTIRSLQPAGRFLVDGVRFHMPGDWVIRVRFHDAQGWDSITIPFRVEFASAVLRSLWIGSRQSPRPDSSNRFADSPEAAALGKRLFEDKRLSGDGTVSCATCHVAEKAFADNLRFSAPGLRRNTQSLLGVADAAWLFWDGRRDSLWSQALAPIESPLEMKNTRKAAVAAMLKHYGPAYRQLAGLHDPSDTDRAFANLGKFIAAYERTLSPAPSRFDRHVEGVRNALTADELAGLEVFLRPESQCLNCHNGPLFTNHAFHNIGAAVLDGPTPDFGRAMGVQALAFDVFNCRSVFSDAAGNCPSQEHALTADHSGALTGAFKTPTLRNVGLTAPYMHDGSLATLEDVIEHYRHPPKSDVIEIKPLQITDAEARQLAAFLRSLTSQ